MTTPSPSILLVEDDPDQRELAMLALAAAGLDGAVAVARDGEDAISYLFGEAAVRELAELPRLVVLDLHLPRVDGFEVLHRIRGCASTRHLPTVVYSSSEDPAEIRRAYDLGANSFVRKPTDFDAYAEQVQCLARYWLNTNRPIDVEETEAR